MVEEGGEVIDVNSELWENFDQVISKGDLRNQLTDNSDLGILFLSMHDTCILTFIFPIFALKPSLSQCMDFFCCAWLK